MPQKTTDLTTCMHKYLASSMSTLQHYSKWVSVKEGQELFFFTCDSYLPLVARWAAKYTGYNAGGLETM